MDQKVYLFYLKSLQSKNVILLYDFINFMNFGDGQFWFYEIIVCNILVEPPLPLGIGRLKLPIPSNFQIYYMIPQKNSLDHGTINNYYIAISNNQN